MDNDRCDTCNSELVDYGTPKGIDCPLCLMRERAERLRLERKADRLARQTQRPNATPSATPGATPPAVNRDTFVKFYTTPDYAVVEDLAHSLGFNGQLKAFYTDGRRSVSRLAQLVGVNPRTAQRWVDTANVATDVASDVAP